MDDSERVIRELSKCPPVDGATMAGILELPDPLRPTLKEMVRGRSFTYGEICESLGVDEETANQVVDLLVEKGYVQATDVVEGKPAYRVALSPIRGHPIDDVL